MAIELGANDGQTNGTTAVDVVPVPDAGTQRVVRVLRVYNRDSVSHTVTLIYNVGGTLRYIDRQTIASLAAYLFIGEKGEVLILDGITKKLQIVLAAAHTTTPLDWVSGWMDET